MVFRLNQAASLCKSCTGIQLFYSFTYVYGYFHYPTAELNSCNRDPVIHKAKNIYHLALQKKSLLTPVDPAW